MFGFVKNYFRRQVAAEVESDLGAKERQSRMRMNELVMRHIASAQEDRRRRNWNARSLSADAENLAHLPLTRARARLMAENDPKAVGIVSKDMTNVVGPGIRPSARCPAHVREKYSLTDEQVTEMCDRAEAYWRDVFTKGRDFDRRRRLTYLQLQRLRYRTWDVDGHVFVRYHTVTGRRTPCAIRIVEADCIGTPPQYSHRDNITNGVQFNPDTDELEGYWVATSHPGALRSAGIRYEFVPVRNELGLPAMAEYFDPARDSSTFGTPRLAPVLPLLHDTADYKDSELQSKILEADASLIVKSSTPDELAKAMQNDTSLTAPGAGQDPNSTRGPDIVSMSKRNVYFLKPDEEFNIPESNRPGNTYEPFLESMDRDIGHGVGRSFEFVSNNYGAANFSATRVSGIEDNETFRVDHELFCEAMLDPDWEWAMYGAALAYKDPRLREIEVHWRRNVKPSWDAQRDAEASQVRLETKTTSPQHETAAMGLDYEDQLELRLKAEKLEAEKRAAMGLPAAAPAEPKQKITVKTASQED